jgi:phenylalanyl-tRNA synthetase beta chain
VRPFVVAAVLRGVTFDATRYKSFIDLQVLACTALITICTLGLSGTPSATCPARRRRSEPCTQFLQDKLHQNLCRQRSLVSVGTHDLATVKPPFTYEALPPAAISFVPLKQETEFRADKLLDVSITSMPHCERCVAASRLIPRQLNVCDDSCTTAPLSFQHGPAAPSATLASR